MRAPRILAVTVNHNTSAYMELMLRSLHACGERAMLAAITVFDNGSTDDMAALRDYAACVGVPVVPSGFGLQTAGNSHGDVLAAFVQANPDCTHYLFLDADVVFVRAGTIGTLLGELGRQPAAFGIGARPSWDGVTAIPEETRRQNPDIADARLHPCCALVHNTALFRDVVATFGLGCYKRQHADREEYLDTFKLMTRVMRTHGRGHAEASVMVRHFFCTSYAWDPPELKAAKEAARDALLRGLRAQQPA